MTKPQSLCQKASVSRWAQAVVDGVIICLAVSIGFLVRYRAIPELYYPSFLQLLPVWLIVNFATLSIYELYGKPPCQWRELRSRLLVGYGVSFLIVLASSYLLRDANFPRPVMAVALVVTVALGLVWRRLLWRAFHQSIENTKVLVIDTSPSIVTLAKKVESALGSQVVQIELGPSDRERAPRPLVDGSMASYVAAAQEGLCSDEVRAVVVGPDVPYPLKCAIATEGFKAGKEVHLVPSWYDILLSRATLSQVDDTPTLTIQPPRHLDRIPTGKRLLDVAISLPLVIVLAPLMLLIAVAVRLDSPGPALFRQERVGLGNRPFTLLKFRTMVADAERLTGPVLATENDPRLTRVGRFLRATRLDELPQLFNVLRGEMSLVGPRPERPFFVNTFSSQIPHYEQRHRVPGGVTGLAQVLGRYSTSPEDKLRYDLLYAGSASAISDLRILLKTVATVFNRRSAS